MDNPYYYWQVVPHAPALVSIAVTPANSTITTGRTRQMTAIATFADGSTADVTDSSVWSSGDATKVSINAATGLATGVAPGTVALTATKSGIPGSTNITDVAPFNPTTFALSRYQRNYANVIPWPGTASAGISGNYNEGNLSANPVANNPWNGINGAEYSRADNTVIRDGGGVPQNMETFVTNAEYTLSWLVDIMGPGQKLLPVYQRGQIFAADAHWGWGFSGAAAMINQSPVIIDAVTQTITRNVGSFLTDHFAIGQTVYLRRTALNDGFVGVPISAVTATTLTFAGGALQSEVIPLANNACITAGPYVLTIFVYYVAAFRFVEFAITPGRHWVYVRRDAVTGNIQVDIDGVPAVEGPQALAQHSGVSGIQARTNNSLSNPPMDFIVYEEFAALVKQTDAQRDNYKSYLNNTFNTNY